MKTVFLSLSLFLLFFLSSCEEEVCTKCTYSYDLFGSRITEDYDEQCGTEAEIAKLKNELQALEDELTKDGDDLNTRILCVDL